VGGAEDEEIIIKEPVSVNAGEFKHSPLQGKTRIRLLNLLPSAAFKSPVEVQLDEVDLAGKPDYEALSYAWGDQTSKVGIGVDGRRLDVTVNCALALQHLRCETQLRTLWVDAVCIDQTDEDECNQQVAIMGDVYETAQRVLVWLGPRATASDVTMAMLKDFEKAFGDGRAAQDAWARRLYRKLTGVCARSCSCF
jgi:hypothetical protein